MFLSQEDLNRYAHEGHSRAQAQPTIENALMGVIDTDDPWFALRVLIEHYLTSRDQAVTFAKGDLVRVRRRYVELGSDHRRYPGWDGCAAMFSDEVAVVQDVTWNSYREKWNILAVYENAYYYRPALNDYFTHPSSRGFYFDVQHLKAA